MPSFLSSTMDSLPSLREGAMLGRVRFLLIDFGVRHHVRRIEHAQPLLKSSMNGCVVCELNSLILTAGALRTSSAILSDRLSLPLVHEASATRSPLKDEHPEVTVKVAIRRRGDRLREGRGA